jgi:hypothetical protein
MSKTKASTTPTPPTMSGIGLDPARHRARPQDQARRMKIAATPEPIGALRANDRRAQFGDLFLGHVGQLMGLFGISPWPRRRKRRLPGGAFGHGGVPGFLSVQLDHRGLALLADIGPQAAPSPCSRRSVRKIVWLPTSPPLAAH